MKLYIKIKTIQYYFVISLIANKFSYTKEKEIIKKIQTIANKNFDNYKNKSNQIYQETFAFK